MLMTKRLAALLLTTTAAVMLLDAPARADGVNPVDCSKTPNDPRCTVQVGGPGAPKGPGSGSGGSGGGSTTCHDQLGREVPCSLPDYGQLADDGCYYKPATGNDLAAAEALGGPATPPDQWYVGACGYPPVAGLVRYRTFAGGVLPDPAVLAAQAVKELRLPLPAIRVNPVPPAAQLVYLPTWLWLDGSSWGAKSATAAVPGLSVTATAKPSRLVFSTSDGATVSCPGPGTAWTAGKDPNAASPDCGHTYTRPGSYALTATVTWQVGWAGGGRTGTVPDLITTSTITLNVTESQALNTNTQG
jgi:hypothetical protein